MATNWEKLKKKQSDKLVSIGQVASKLFSENGYLETSLEDIADAAGISKGALYYYFPSKVEILYFIIDTHGDRILENLEQELEQIEDGYAKIRFFISRHVHLYIENMHESKIFIKEKNYLSAKYLKKIKEKETKYYQVASNVLLDFLGNRISKDELTALTFSLFGLCTWIYWWYDPKGALTPQELSESIYDLFSKGVSRYE